MASASFVNDLGIVLGVATATGVLCRRFNQPSILGYLAAGLIVGGSLPIPLFADMERVHSLSEFGVVLVMFAIGLEFQLSRLFKVLPVAGFAALIQIGTLLWFGFSLGRVWGWETIESLFLGAGICISSTMLVSKIFEEKPVSKEVRTLVLGILVLQDVAAIALIATMSAVTESGVFSLATLSMTLGKLILTLALMVATGLLVVPRLIRYVLKLNSTEATIVTAVGLCFSFSLLAESLGYSVALGAFVAGLLVSESGHGHEVEHMIKPIKDMFAAIFFVSIGMTVDPGLAFNHFGASLTVFAGVLIFQLLSISMAGVLSGNSLKQSLTAGLSLGQIGEFGFIIAAIGIAADVVRPALQPILVTVAVLTAFTTPLALEKSARVMDFVDRHLPNRFKHLLAVYESWFESLRSVKEANTRSPARRALRAVILDILGWTLLAAVFLYNFEWITTWLGNKAAIPQAYQAPIVYGLLALFSIPPLFGLIRNTLHLEEAVVAEIGKQPSRAQVEMTVIGISVLRSSIRVLVMMGAGIPAAALLRPLNHSLELGVVLFAGIFVMLTFFWKSAGRLDAEIRSEAERLVAFLDQQRAVDQPEAPPQPFFPDLGKMEAVYIPKGSPMVGRSLSEINLRAVTGALVVAIHREGMDLVLPTGSKRINADDLLFVTGSSKAVALAYQLLSEESDSDPLDDVEPTD